jgi:WD40 repeat protein
MQDPVLQLHQQRGQAGAKHGMCMAVQLAQDSTSVYAWVGYEDGVVALWDIRQPGAPLSELRVHEEPVMALAVDVPHGRALSAAADAHLSVIKYDLAGDAQLVDAGQLPLPTKPGGADLSLRWDGRVVASAGWDCKVRLWSLKKHQLLAVGQYHSNQVTCVEFNEQQQVLASGSQDCNIAVWPAKPV